MLSKKKELKEEITRLEKENQELLIAIKRIDNKENFETVKHYTKYCHKAMYRKIPFSFLDTVFYSQKELLFKYANGCFYNAFLDRAYDSAKRYQDELVMSIAMFCSQTIKTDNGIIFILTDPYRTIATKPSTRISDKSAESCKDRMLVANLVIPENHRAVKSYEMKGYRLLKMSLRNVFGKEQVKADTLFTQYKNIKKENEAILAINTIEQHYIANYECVIRRYNDTSLRILTDKKLIAISYEKGELWYADQPSDHLMVCQCIKEMRKKATDKKSILEHDRQLDIIFSFEQNL